MTQKYRKIKTSVSMIPAHNQELKDWSYDLGKTKNGLLEDILESCFAFMRKHRDTHPDGDPLWSLKDVLRGI